MRCKNCQNPAGGGCHVAILGAANRGAYAGLSPGEVFQHIREHVRGSRPVPDGEIWDAVNKAFADQRRIAPQRGCQSRGFGGPFSQLPVLDAGKMLRAIQSKGYGARDVELWESSPIRIDWPPQQDAAELLRALYTPDELIFIGQRNSSGRANIRRSTDWVDEFDAGSQVPEHIIPNPVTGNEGRLKTPRADGSVSTYRGDDCIAKYRFAVLEFDVTPAPLREPGAPVTPWARNSQCEFWAGVT